MRLHVRGVQDPKGVLADDVLPDGTVVKKGELVAYVPYSQARMIDVWGADATQFRPERWLKDGVFIPASPFKFNAFQVCNSPSDPHSRCNNLNFQFCRDSYKYVEIIC